MTGVFVLFILGGLTLVIGLGILGYLADKRRREAMQALATARGWTYTERDDRWTDRFPGSPFGLGHNRQAKNILTGRYDDRPFVAFDYVYYTTETRTDSEGHTHTEEQSHSYSIVAVDLGAAFPELEVTPEGFFSRMIGRLTDRDIELESEDFNRAFTVTCPDRKFAFDVLHPRMMEYLLGHTDEAFRFAGGHLLVAAAGQAGLPEIDAALAFVDGIADRIPEFVWRAVGLPAPRPGAAS
ncbi:DUF3137 domain-containing protein [Nocardioides sp.]|uniref:DUF3137 domain-containing protein n=1 Tax=Nocardioides sp. TaxID=35761 RepID=UPI00352771D9